MFADAGPLPPPNNLHMNVANFDSRELTFTWSPVFPDCNSINYNILASNCGNCSSITTKTTASCTDVPTTYSMCRMAIQTVLCGFVVGNLSDQITVATINTEQNIQQGTIILYYYCYTPDINIVAQ